MSAGHDVREVDTLSWGVGCGIVREVDIACVALKIEPPSESRTSTYWAQMHRTDFANQFQHIVFPHEAVARPPIDLTHQNYPSLSGSQGEHVLPDDESQFLAWLFEKAGLELRRYRSETLHRRMSACLRTLRATSPQHARQLIEQTPKLLNRALNAMLVGVTSFFRDPSVFDQLKSQILPELSEQRKGIYAWSIGCSDGAELYSLAILLAEAELLAKSYLLGTDCRADAIDYARAGRYDQATIAGVSNERLGKFFEVDGAGWKISTTVHKAVRWRIGNMLGDLEAGLWDLILIRNTSMYLRTEAAMSLWPRLEAALRPGGVLVLGRAERPYGATRLRMVGPCLYRRHRS